MYTLGGTQYQKTPGVYPLEPIGKDWFVCEHTRVKAKRTGFQVVPDFSATAHMLQGATLIAAIVDCLEAGHLSRLADMLAAYVGLSRAKLKETVVRMAEVSHLRIGEKLQCLLRRRR